MELNKENYHSIEANQEYMSATQFKGFVHEFGGCEAKSMAILTGKWSDPEKVSFLQGKYVHAWNEGKLEEFKESNPEIIASTGKNKGELKADFALCEKIIDKIKNDDLFMEALSGEKEKIFTANIFGIKWKCCIDSYLKNKKRFADLKILRSLNDKIWNKYLGCYENVFNSYGYFIQMAIYAEIERKARRRRKKDWYEPFIAVATKEEEPNIDIISFNSKDESYGDFIEYQLNIVKDFIGRVKRVKAGKEKPRRCGFCNFCISTKKLTGTTHYSEYDF